MNSTSLSRLSARFPARFSARLAVAALGVSAIALTGAAIAQDGGAAGGLILPDNPAFFAKNDPNHRKATVIVNGEIITGTDVDQRVALIVNASGGKVSDEELGRLKLQVLRNLMDETLQIQEAKAQKVDVDNSEVDQTFARIAQQNFGQDVKAMEAYLAKIGSSAASLKRQIRGELSWNRLLRRNVQPFVNVSDEEVREVLKRMQEAKGTEEYRVGEIFLSATSENRDAVYQNAQKIVEQLKGGGSFVGYARQFSEASTAATGGDLGWVKRGVLPTELDALLPTIQSGQLVGPVEIRGGFSILLLIDKRQVLTADPRDAVLSLKQISIGFAPGVTETQATTRAKAFADAMGAARGCANADEVAASLGADVVNNDQIKARDLPTPLQNLVLSLNLGETTPPFGSIQEGVRVLMLCGRDDPKADSGPDFEQVQSQMEDERVNKRAQTYLRDLRRDAVIDYN
ncbi:peptidylprolyl isomerase [Novosphingobium arvoryzae]|uniref:Parvulin-like PPIase n=1 Tax=Novosphingobium arvoryzae TaxID=1256514 RepID=A0A918VCR5_9SPHN|nr:chaperone SurA [Novosphingobium arvoryzae]